MPWQKPPAWLDLPHQFDGLETYPSRVAANPRGNTDGNAQAETGGGGGNSNADSSSGRHRVHHSGACTIRGREIPLGERGNIQTGTEMRRDGARGDPDRTIRGPGRGPGTGEEGKRRSAEAKLAAANAHLWRSLEDHAERVEKRKAEDARCLEQPNGPKLSAAERMKALRRRIADKADAEIQGDARPAQTAQPETGGPRLARQVRQTIEVSNIHQDGTLHGGEAVRDGARGRASSVNADTAAAACYEAWHGGAGSSSERRAR